MTNAQMKEALEKAGVKAADVSKVASKFDAEKITKAVESAATPDEAIKAVASLYPEINAKELKKQYDFYAEQLKDGIPDSVKAKAPMELSEDELENVAGGSAVGDWFAKNWKVLVVGLAVGIAASIGLSFAGAAIGAKAGSAVAIAKAATFGLAVNSVSAAGVSMGTMIGASVGVAVGIGATAGMAFTENALNS